MKTFNIVKSVYPDGKVQVYQNGAQIRFAKAPETKDFNKWIKYIYKQAK